jgi:hypothetical protein
MTDRDPEPAQPESPPTPLLSIELVPRTVWESNVRSLVAPGDWDRIRKDTYAKAGQRCEVCGGRGPRHPVECHEVWHYDDALHVQRLVRMIALCPACHEVKHFGLAGIRGRRAEATHHLMQVNGWNEAQARAHIAEATATWKERSTHEWSLDLSALAQYGLDAAVLDAAARPPAMSEERLQQLRKQRQARQPES